MTTVNRLAERLGLDPRALLGLAALVAGTLVWVLAFTGGLASLFSSHTTVVKADFASIEDIVANDPVRIDGVQVGSVGGETADPNGRGATLTLELDSNAPPIYNNASASILWRTALGANDAVALTPGTRATGPLRARTIPQSQDSNQVELDQITQGAFHGGAQSGTRTMLQQLAPALSDHPALGQALNTLAEVAPTAAVGIGALRGEVPNSDLKALVHDAAQAAQALDVGTGGAETRQFVQSAASTLTALSASKSSLRSTIADAGNVLPQIPPTANAVNHALDLLDPLVARLTTEAPQVAPTLGVLRPAVVDLHSLLNHATPLLRKLNPTVDSLARTATVGTTVINEVSPSLQRLAKKILPGLAEKGPEEGGHPVYDEIGSFLNGLAGMSAFFNRDGSLANFTIGLSDPQSVQLLPCTEDFSGADFLVCSSLSEALNEFLTGGTSLLGSLARRPGLASTYGPLLAKAHGIQSALNATKSTLESKFPTVAKYLFKPNHGAGQ